MVTLIGNPHILNREILDKKPDLVFVALGFPKQEQWISKHLCNI